MNKLFCLFSFYKSFLHKFTFVRLIAAIKCNELIYFVRTLKKKKTTKIIMLIIVKSNDNVNSNNSNEYK